MVLQRYFACSQKLLFKEQKVLKNFAKLCHRRIAFLNIFSAFIIYLRGTKFSAFDIGKVANFLLPFERRFLEFSPLLQENSV